jgi:hypothetical protein
MIDNCCITWSCNLAFDLADTKVSQKRLAPVPKNVCWFDVPVEHILSVRVGQGM